MAGLKEAVALSLAARYTKLAGVVRELASPLSGEQFWTKPFTFGNSFGHLVLHRAGNSNYYIGAQIAGTGYVRDRPREFSETARPSKQDVLKKFDDAVALVTRDDSEPVGGGMVGGLFGSGCGREGSLRNCARARNALRPSCWAEDVSEF